MEELTLSDYITILRQRRVSFLWVFGLITLISIILALVWSNYRSTATIEIEQPQVASEITTPTGMNPNEMPEALADLQVNRIKEKVTSPSSLVDIITKYNLYPNKRDSEPMATVADDMAAKIKLKLISSEIANPSATQKVSVGELSAIAFTLSFDYSDPQTAQKVTNELVTRFLDEDLKDRRNQADVTSDFIQAQITALEATMVEQEKKIADFQAEHGVTQPETLMFNQQAAANVQLSIQNLDGQIASNEGTQGSLRAQLATVEPYTRVIADGQVLTTPAVQLKALRAQYATLTAQYGPEHPDVVKIKHQIDALQAETGGSGGTDTSALRAQIVDVKTNLKAAEATDGPDNPDVKSLKMQLESLQHDLAEARRSGSKAADFHRDADNPAYLELVAQLHAAEEQHKTLLDQREKLSAREEKFQQAVLANPALQQQMALLTRDYDNAQLRFREMKEKKMAADMDKQMIEDRHGQRLAVINPPELPLHTHPHQILILLAGLMLAGLAGLTTVAVRQIVHQSIFGAHQVAALVGVTPLVVVPYLETEEEHQKRLHKRAFSLFKSFMAKQQELPADTPSDQKVV